LTFTNSSCELCDQAIEILEGNAFNYEDYNLETKTDATEILITELEYPESIEGIMFPVLKIEDTLYTSIKTRQEFIDILKLHFE
jgi:glutaredoxin